MRFELIDRVVERGPDRIVAIKSVSLAEEYLADHFPGYPVLPGVMMLETLVQAGRLLLGGDPKAGQGHVPGGAGPLVLGQVRNVRYANMVRPGQCLQVEVTLRTPGTVGKGATGDGRGGESGGWEFAGVGTVDGQVAVQGRFRLVPLRLGGACDATVAQATGAAG